MSWSQNSAWSAGRSEGTATPDHQNYAPASGYSSWYPGSWGNQTPGDEGGCSGQGKGNAHQPGKGLGVPQEQHDTAGYGQPKGKDHGGKTWQPVQQGKGGYASKHGWEGQASGSKQEDPPPYPPHVGDRHYDMRKEAWGRQTPNAPPQMPKQEPGYEMDGQVDNRLQFPRLVRQAVEANKIDLEPWESDRGQAKHIMQEIRRLFYKKVRKQSAPGDGHGPETDVWPCVHHPHFDDVRPLSIALSWVGRAIQLRLDNNVQLAEVNKIVGTTWPFVNFVKEFRRLHPDAPDRNPLYKWTAQLARHSYMFQANAHYTIALVLLVQSQYDAKHTPGQVPHFQLTCNDSLPDADPNKIQVWVRPGKDGHAWQNAVDLKMYEKMKTPINLPPRPDSRLPSRWDQSACRNAMGLHPPF